MQNIHFNEEKNDKHELFQLTFTKDMDIAHWWREKSMNHNS